MAAFMGIPILLTDTEVLPPATNQAITDLGITDMILVGGKAVLMIK